MQIAFTTMSAIAATVSGVAALMSLLQGDRGGAFIWSLAAAFNATFIAL